MTPNVQYITIVYFAGTYTAKNPSSSTTSYSPTVTTATSTTTISITTTTPTTQTDIPPSEDDSTDMGSAASSTQSTGEVGHHYNT